MRYDDEARERALAAMDRDGPALTHRRIVKLVGENRSVLELGCATGYVSKMMTENGCQVTGIELDEKAAETARSVCYEVITGDAGDPAILNQAGSEFDVIVCGDILEHLPDPESILHLLHKHLNPKGFVLVSMPNVAFWQMRWDLLLGRFNYKDYGLLDRTHLRFYTVKSFRRMAIRTGYIISDEIVNESGFPGSRILCRIPLIGRIFQSATQFLTALNPNLFAFHSIYKLIPQSVSKTE
jgi:2-polyprenyl-3-methyl-5-hydroxy-6-metoxy-1,4-benzoquinol methylase